MKSLIFLLIFFMHTPAYAAHAKWGFNVKQEGAIPITRLQIFSERCSGSNFISTLLFENLALSPGNSNYGPFGHKHFPPWLQLPIDTYKGPQHFYTFDGSDDTLFVVIFRNPYDWLRSFNLQTHFGANELLFLPFSEFIRKPWRADENSGEIAIQKQYNPFLDCNPETKMAFDNVMHLRSAKIRTMLSIRDRVKNAYYINYEVANKHPKKVVAEISKIFSLERKMPFKKIKTYKGEQNGTRFTPKVYPRMKKSDIQYINEHLDKHLEELINYTLKAGGP